MKVLGIDFGLKKVGIAISDGMLAEPLIVLREKTRQELISEIKNISEKEKIEKIVVGVSEGKIAQLSLEFIEELKKETDIPVTQFDETLSTYDAQRLGIEAGMKRSKRKRIEDAMAAAVMLQNYIDINL